LGRAAYVKRGQVIIAAARGDFTSKPRPYVVVQNDRMIENSSTVTVCPLTGRVLGASLVRVEVEPDPENGLTGPSEIEVDRITTLRKIRIDKVVGVMNADVMNKVDQLLKRWLAL
jgi:mRNA interferase MazF